MKTQSLRKYAGIVLFISFALGILIHFENILDLFDSVARNNKVIRRPEEFPDVISGVFISSMVAFCTFIINFYIIRPLDRNVKIDFKRIIIAVVLTIVSVTILSDLFFSVKHILSAGLNPRRFNILYTFRDMFTAIVVISGVYFIKTVYDKQAIRMENEKLKNENLQSQYESLKNQVSPHFLFNSLTALKELINQNPASAQNYISHLSLVMRYTLQSNESMTQCLRDEMQVADSYLFLVKIRFGANLIIEKNIDPGYDFHLLPPLALQTLIENAIKHNEISKRFPLTIKMETTENQCLRVTNTLQEKITPEFSTGKGLTNLSRQYQFLSGNDITISKKNHSFIVDLPLLSPQNDKSINR
jgi:hypothetical protein